MDTQLLRNNVFEKHATLPPIPRITPVSGERVAPTACSRRCYRAAPAKDRVILASLAREGVFNTRNAAEANR